MQVYVFIEVEKGIIAGCPTDEVWRSADEDWRSAVEVWRLAVEVWRLAVEDWRSAVEDWRLIYYKTKLSVFQLFFGFELKTLSKGKILAWKLTMWAL